MGKRQAGRQKNDGYGVFWVFSDGVWIPFARITGQAPDFCTTGFCSFFCNYYNTKALSSMPLAKYG